MKALVTGSAGFIGRHLVAALARREGVEVIEYDLGSPPGALEAGLRTADIVYHLAGVNRPPKVEEFRTGNVGLTEQICAGLERLGRTPVVVLSSSIQALLDNPYGVSKREAEQVLEQWTARSGGRAVIFRLKNVFGKWCQPNYNSVTATFCHNIAHDLPIAISDPARELELVYIDDVVAGLLGVGDGSAAGGLAGGRCEFREVPRSFRVTLGDLAARIRAFRESRRSLRVPDFADEFNRCLYATYLSYLEGADFAYALEQKTDPRGSLAEFVKSPAAGQIFVSRTKPGITRGNHFHHTKTEKFLVVEGEAIVRFRKIGGRPRTPAATASAGGTTAEPAPEVIAHPVSGKEFKVVDIPPGYTHSIENVGTGELVTLFWASEVFDPQRPDTYWEEVL